MADLSPIIEPALRQRQPAQPALSQWRHSVRKHGLREAIRRLQAVGADTVENLEALFWAHVAEKGDSE